MDHHRVRVACRVRCCELLMSRHVFAAASILIYCSLNLKSNSDQKQMTKTAFTGGALSFKGDKRKKAKKKSRKSKHSKRDEKEIHEAAAVQQEEHEDDDDLTEAERKALKRKMEKERKDLEKVASKSHRERIEEFNEKLGNLTELNDIPRVSAAGNG